MLKRIPWRPFVAAGILLATIALFINYFSTHPEVRHKLSEVKPATLLLLLGLYLAFVGSLSLVNTASLRLCRSTIKPSESLLLTMYSSIINFFGPLQSGPAFRAVYLKQKHGVKFADYTLASFIYYLFYALFSGLLLVSGILKWWLLPISVIFLAVLIYLKDSKPSRLKAFDRLEMGQWYYMALATFLQVSLLAIIFFIELRSVSPSITIGQSLVYTGAANFALFVSLTPGAIGFRESFLLFTQNLHDIKVNTIVAASTIDRGAYIIMLLIISMFVLTTHTKRRLTAFAAKS